MTAHWRSLSERFPEVNEEFMLGWQTNTETFFADSMDSNDEFDVRGRANESMSAWIISYLQWPIALKGQSSFQGLAELVVETSIDYLFGSWRLELTDQRGRVQTPEVSRNTLPWIDEYRAGLTAALLLDDQPSIIRLTTWPREDLKFSEVELEFESSLNGSYVEYHCALAKFLREREWDMPTLDTAQGTDATRRVKYLAEAARAAARVDAHVFLDSLSRFLAAFVKEESDRGIARSAFSFEGSILMAIARKQGIELNHLAAPLRRTMITEP